MSDSSFRKEQAEGKPATLEEPLVSLLHCCRPGQSEDCMAALEEGNTRMSLLAVSLSNPSSFSTHYIIILV